MPHRSIRIGFAVSGLALAACNAGPAPKSTADTLARTPSVAPGAPQEPNADDEGQAEAPADVTALLALLPSARIDLDQAIAQSERQGARAISAKFELHRGQLSLSVYTAKRGIDQDAEHNVLAELSGDPTQPNWHPQEEIFADAQHLTRASYHLTLVQRSKMTLADVIAKALAKQPGQVYSIEPSIHDRSPIFHVLIATSGGGHVNVDVESGA